MNEKILIFDASSIISLAMNGLLFELKELKKIFKGKFIIPEEVKWEAIERPLKTKKFELEALQVNQLFEEKVLELPDSIGISKKEISEGTTKILEKANNIFSEQKKKNIHIIDLGETACIVLSKILKEKNIENIIVVDERTTRLLSEKPENLRKLLQKKLHSKIEIDKEKLKYFSGLKIIRSAELMWLANEKNLVKIKNKRILDAMLYGVKFKGCAISHDEIEELKKIKLK